MSLDNNPRSPYYDFDELDELNYEELLEFKNTLASVLDEQPRNYKTNSSYDMLNEAIARLKYYDNGGVR
jgi:hypothetical protein